MVEQHIKRGRGRPRTGRNKIQISLTLPKEVVEYLASLPAGEQSRYMAQAAQEKMQRERTGQS